MSAASNTATIEENKAIIRRARKLWTGKNLAIIDELYAPDYRNHDPAQPDVCTLAEFKHWIGEFHDNFSVLHFTSEDTLVENDKIAECWSLCSKSRQDDEWFKWSVMSIYRLAGGRIAECWWSYDGMSFPQNRSFLQQLGPPGRRKFWQLVLEDQLPCKEESRERNVAITAQYASWYLQKPELFKWAGMAAFVSNNVGLFISIADEGEWKLFKETNNAIFEDIGWTFLAYKKTGFEEIKGILGFEPHTYFMLKGFQLIKRGADLLNDNEKMAMEVINLGNGLLARHEQYGIAQKFFGQYGPPIRALLFTMLGLIDFDGDPLRVSKSFQVRFRDLVDPLRFMDFGKADERWEFVRAKLFPTWREAEGSRESRKALKNLAQKKSAVNAGGMIGFGAKALTWMTDGVSGVVNWLLENWLPKTDSRSSESSSESTKVISSPIEFTKKVLKAVLRFVSLISRFLVVLVISQLILITPGLAIVLGLLWLSRLMDWWDRQPPQRRQALVRNLWSGLAYAAGIILLVLGCRFLSRWVPDIAYNLSPPSTRLHSTFVSSQATVRSRIGRPLQIDSYHTSPDRVDSVEIFINGQRLGETDVSGTEQTDIFPSHLGRVQVQSRGSLEGHVFRPEFSNTATTVILIWQGYVPGTYELRLVAKDKAGHVGRPIVRRIEVRQ